MLKIRKKIENPLNKKERINFIIAKCEYETMPSSYILYMFGCEWNGDLTAVFPRK